MKKQRLISMLLVLTMLSSSTALLSCSSGTENADEMVSSAENPSASEEIAVETEEAKDSLEARMDVADNLPDKKFDGRTFAVIGDDACTDHYLSEELNGEPVNDAVFERNSLISERFDVALDAVVYAEDQITGQAKNAVAAADDAFQMMACHIIYLGMSATGDYMYNWYDLPNVNFDQPWWSDSTVTDLKYKDKAFVAIGDFALSALGSTYCMFYNKVMAENYGLPDMYGLVEEGGWTIDKQYEFSNGVYTDTNGDGIRDINDTYALSTDCKSNANAYLWAFGKKIATQQDDGTYVLDYYDEKLVSLVEKLYNLYYETDYVYFDTTSHGIGQNVFPLGNNLFTNGAIGWMNGVLRDVEFDYGIIPYPKWDEKQAEYYTSVDGGHEGLAILKTITDPEFVGIVSEALNAESWKRVVPAYYDVSLKFKGTRDEQSIAMLDRIVDSRIFDFGYVYGGWGCVFWIQYLLEGASKDITSYYEKNFKPYNKTMEKVFETFDEYTKEP